MSPDIHLTRTTLWVQDTQIAIQHVVSANLLPCSHSSQAWNVMASMDPWRCACWDPCDAIPATQKKKGTLVATESCGHLSVLVCVGGGIPHFVACKIHI